MLSGAVIDFLMPCSLGQAWKIKKWVTFLVEVGNVPCGIPSVTGAVHISQRVDICTCTCDLDSEAKISSAVGQGQGALRFGLGTCKVVLGHMWMLSLSGSPTSQ